METFSTPKHSSHTWGHGTKDIKPLSFGEEPGPEAPKCGVAVRANLDLLSRAGRVGVPQAPALCSGCPKPRIAELGSPSAPERQWQLLAGSAQPSQHTGLFVLFIKQEQIAPGSFNPRLGFHRHSLLSQHNPEAAAALGGAGSDTKSRAQGLLPDSCSL